eukprot:CAMPEP_0182947726 /NCGR_PEP_ID=MMETSP0105_2-20130417/59062_1 /TAXON_ID=81532 ORGANISM="Acanthoeca-like sp., Strain 10tr" /NCGR_SAMPLE_ID=MMETSP0105_2 /ASSEMBLY_ACC=CAM_ASM_000205 /LENGTH=64 /DNA_ID=CAMNT_0025087987 /DNA_START=61 /DNA_END=251 /DNA_ORIENTATION=+
MRYRARKDEKLYHCSWFPVPVSQGTVAATGSICRPKRSQTASISSFELMFKGGIAASTPAYEMS